LLNALPVRARGDAVELDIQDRVTMDRAGTATTSRRQSDDETHAGAVRESPEAAFIEKELAELSFFSIQGYSGMISSGKPAKKRIPNRWRTASHHGP